MRALDEAYALTTFGTAASDPNLLRIAKGTHEIGSIEFGVNFFLALRGMGKDENAFLRWLDEQSISDEWTYLTMSIESIMEMMLNHIGLSRDQINEQADLVRKMAHRNMTIFRHQVLTVFEEHFQEIRENQETRELLRRYEDYN